MPRQSSWTSTTSVCELRHDTLTLALQGKRDRQVKGWRHQARIHPYQGLHVSTNKLRSQIWDLFSTKPKAALSTQPTVSILWSRTSISMWNRMERSRRSKEMTTRQARMQDRPFYHTSSGRRIFWAHGTGYLEILHSSF